MSSSNVGLVMRAWFRWKSLRLPWRKRFLVGSDLSGNTYWVFRLTGNTPPPSPSDTPAYQSSADDTRWRRIVKYPRSTHYSDVQVPPQWHQWLRYQRHDPPSLQEQQENVLRRQRMKVLAAEADARWAAKPSFLDQPAGQPAPNAAAATQAQDALTSSSSANADDATTTQGEEGKEPTKGEEEKTKKKTLEEKEDPWKKATASGPSEEWQPTAWSPNNARKR
ncbi:LuxS/MPP-like metallohydrolase [Apiospora arundinis]